MTTPQPARLRPSSPTRYEQISRHLLQQAEDELDKGDVLQASEKIWLAVAHSVKAVAQDRGWNHRYHNHLRAALAFLSTEWTRTDWQITFSAIENLHTNAYEHQEFVRQIQPFLNAAENFCNDMVRTRRSSPPEASQSEAQRRDQQRLLRILTRPLNDLAAFGPQYTP